MCDDDPENDEEIFDPRITLAEYRRVIQLRDASSVDCETTQFDGLIGWLRAAWKDWSGEDRLHEAAFGEPDKWPSGDHSLGQ